MSSLIRMLYLSKCMFLSSAIYETIDITSNLKHLKLYLFIKLLLLKYQSILKIIIIIINIFTIVNEFCGIRAISSLIKKKLLDTKYKEPPSHRRHNKCFMCTKKHHNRSNCKSDIADGK